MSLTQLLHRVEPRKLFLIDSVGGFVSAIMLGIVLPSWEEVFGVPEASLHLLAYIACGFCIYSFSCFLLNPPGWRLFLRVIAIANLLYCCLTAVAVLGMESEITLWGVVYFVGEIAIVVGLAYMEIKKASIYF